MRKFLFLTPIFVCSLLLFSCKNDKENSNDELPEEVTITENSDGSVSAEEIEPDPEIDEAVEDSIHIKEFIPSPDQYFYALEGEKAAVQVRVGDVDNLGFGFEEGFDPFCGKNTKVHSYPWEVDSTDYPGTDRIMVVSAYRRARSDGYTSRTLRAHTDPVAIAMKYEVPSIEIQKIVLQLMLDDFQAPVWGSSFQFYINEKRLIYVEPIINNLNQTGPTGKLVQVGILPEDFHLFETGEITISIDDPVNDAGDGFAIDFIQMLINPKQEYVCHGTITGVVYDEQNNPLTNVLVSANGLKDALTGSDGTFELLEVPVGMISVFANKKDYQPASENFELKREEKKEVTLILKQKEAEDESYLSEELNEKGFVNLYGILFDSGKDIPKAESESVLNELANYLRNNENIQIEIIGHTDSEGDDGYNRDLSQRRAASVKNWLSKQDLDTSPHIAIGKGESSPVASNDTEAGKALNRRVEVRIIR